METLVDHELVADTGVVAPARSERRLPAALRSFASRDFDLYFFGLVVSVTGTWMQKVAESWLIYRLTNSAFSLGLIGFLSLVPLVPVSLWAGVLADRMSRRKLLMIAQWGQLFPPLVLAALTWLGVVQVWHIVIADLVLGIFAAIDLPTRQAMIVEIIDVGDMENAMGLSASGLNAARVIGPAVAGVLVASLGEAICFGLNGFSFLAVIVSLALIRAPERIPSIKKERTALSLINGFRYMWTDTTLIFSILLVVLVSLFILPYQTLLPVFARDILNSGASGLGFLSMAAGIGAIVGGLAVAHWGSGKGAIPVIAILGLLSLATVLFSFSTDFGLSFAALVGVGAGVVAVRAICFTIAQRQVADEMRGRVMAMVTMLSGGVPAVGGLVAGFAATRSSPSIALAGSALLCVGICVVLVWRASLRQQAA